MPDIAPPTQAPERTSVVETELRSSPVELTFAIPCLDEAATIARCVEAARRCLEKNGVLGEVVVADNGSADGSAEAARAAGARVVAAPVRGYGAAVSAAVGAARGTFVILGDGDLQHDLEACFPFLERLRAGADLVVGDRYSGASGRAATTLANRLGAGGLSALGRLLFGAPVRDFHCGLRAFRRERFQELDLRTAGFEFTTEQIVRAALRGQRVEQLPIEVRPAGRDRPPHLRPLRDGWRTARFLLLLAPGFTLIAPGAALMLLGAALAALVARGRAVVAGVELDVHTLVLGCMLFLVGATAAQVGFAARIYAMEQEIGPPPRRLGALFRAFSLERGLLLGALIALAGAVPIAELSWRALTVRLRPEEVFATLRPMVIGSTLFALGAETMLMSFFYSMMAVRGRGKG